MNAGVSLPGISRTTCYRYRCRAQDILHKDVQRETNGDSDEDDEEDDKETCKLFVISYYT